MGRVKIPYYVARNGRGYWQPTKPMRAVGFKCVSLGADGPEAWARAKALNDRWQAWRESDRAAAPPAAPPRGSLAEAFARYRQTIEWTKKAPRTREEWERCWTRIAPCFGAYRPAGVTLENISVFRDLVARQVSEREAHRCIKIWRALWRVAAAMGYCARDADPSAGVRNTEPQARQAVWHYSEARQLVRAAWRAGYRGLAAAMAVGWDSALSPIDIRRLTPAQRRRDEAGVYFALGRAKTGRAAAATLTRRGARILDAYIAGLGAEIAPGAPIFRNRSGAAYSKDTMGDDFRTVRAMVFGEAERRTLADFRRSGAVEVMRGGASLALVGQKLANDAGSNPALGRTYVPVDLDAVRKADAARKRGRK